MGSEFGADELVGAAVVDRAGQAIGQIEDLLIDTDGLVRKAVLRSADAAGSRSTVIDLLQLHRQGDKTFVLDAAPGDLPPPSDGSKGSAPPGAGP